MKNLFPLFIFLFSLSKAQSDFKMNQNELVLPAPIVFEAGTAKIKSESEPSLEHIKAYLEAKTYVSLIRIESHTDNSGSESDNQKLSASRAKAIYDWLVNKGVDCKRLIAVGFGSTKPIAANNTPEGRAQNRRTSIHMTELRNRAIGGMPVDGGGQVAASCR